MWPTLNGWLFQDLSTVFFRLVVQGPREIGVSYCVHNVTTAVLPSTSSMETLSSGHIMYTIGHTYFPKSLDNQPKKHSMVVCTFQVGCHWAIGK